MEGALALAHACLPGGHELVWVRMCVGGWGGRPGPDCTREASLQSTVHTLYPHPYIVYECGVGRGTVDCSTVAARLYVQLQYHIGPWLEP